MGERLSVYAGEPLTRLLAFAGASNRSGRLNETADRYLAIVEDELRRMRFSRAEWCAICEAMSSITIDGVTDRLAWGMAWANVADSPGISAKWEIDQEDLARRLRGMSVAAKAAVAEVVARFWERADLAAEAALSQAGVVCDRGL